MSDTTTLAPVLAGHIAAVNAFDQDAIVATLAGDPLVNDVHREVWGREAIRGRLPSLPQMRPAGSASIRTVGRAPLVARAGHPESGSSTAKPPAIP